MSSQPVIEVDDLRKTYQTGLIRRKKVEALRGVSFQVQQGEVFGLLGPNGAGKTTLIKVLLSIVRKSRGKARMLGRPVGHRHTRRLVGYLPESHRIPEHLTGNSALEYYGSLSGLSVSETRRRRPELLRTVGLADWGKMPVKKYSKGMQQRLGLAQAMLHEPELLILDEPTDGVDPIGRTEMRDVLKELASRGKTIFLNSHLLQEIELVCDRVAILRGGRLQHVGGIAELTEAATSEVLLRLIGTEATIRHVLAEKEVLQCRPQADDHMQVIIRAETQNEVDQVIDGLRKSDIGIHSIGRRRLTLEEAFLNLMQEPDGQK